MVRLHSFVGVDSEVASLPLFKKFLTYYAQMGVDEFVLDFHTNTGDLARVEQFAREARRFPCTIRHIIDEPYVGQGNHLDHINLFVREYCSSGTWCLMADTDEFIRFPAPLPRFLQARDRAGDTIVLGHLVDRFSGDGTFPEITDTTDLDQCFPFQYPLTLLVRRGWTRKVVALKAGYETIVGRHALADEGRVAAESEHTHLMRAHRTGSQTVVNCLRRLYPWLERRQASLNRWRGRVEVQHFAWDQLLHAKMMARNRVSDCAIPSEVDNVLRFFSLPNPMAVLHKTFLQRANLRG